MALVVVMQPAQRSRIAKFAAHVREALEESVFGNFREHPRAEQLRDCVHVEGNLCICISVCAVIAVRVDQAERIPALREIEFDHLDCRFALVREIHRRDVPDRDAKLFIFLLCDSQLYLKVLFFAS